jgi:23S rRNA (cytosine1962-C5)-methyltransferase
VIGRTVPTVTLRAGRVLPVWSGHPWVYAQAVERVEGGALAGDEVRVVDPRGRCLGRGLYSPNSAIPVRMFTREDRPIDGELIRRRVGAALALRRRLGLPTAGDAPLPTTMYRAVHGEGDGLPGLIVDVLGDAVSLQFNTEGLRRREGEIYSAIQELLRPVAIIDRTPLDRTASDRAASIKPADKPADKPAELDPLAAVVRGRLPDAMFRFQERGFHYEVPLAIGQKTGFYADQRAVRAYVEQLSRGQRVLDTYCYLGAFALAAARGGASEVLAVDSSALAIEVASENAYRNAKAGYLDNSRVAFVREDAQAALRRAAASGGYDVVLCDPPKLAPSRAHKEKALGMYQALAGLAVRATTAGGFVVFSSCSQAMSMDDVVRVLAAGALDANRRVLVLERFIQGPDHPVPAAFPEGLYLKAVVAQVLALD